MNIELTKHGEKRLNQRGIRLNDAHLICTHGDWMSDDILFVTDKIRNAVIKDIKKAIKFLEDQKPQDWQSAIECLKKQIQRFDKLAGKMVIVNSDSGQFQIITGYQRKNKGKMIARMHIC